MTRVARALEKAERHPHQYEKRLWHTVYLSWALELRANEGQMR
jgi:hypothetical protein